MTLGCPETRQRVAVQLEEGHAVADVLRGFGIDPFDLPAKLLQRGAVRCGDAGEVGVDAFISLGGRGHNRFNHNKRTSPVPEIFQRPSLMLHGPKPGASTRARSARVRSWC